MQEILYFVVKMCFLSVFFLITQETGRENGVFYLISLLKYGSW